jgi:hypothetical protein
MQLHSVAHPHDSICRLEPHLWLLALLQSFLCLHTAADKRMAQPDMTVGHVHHAIISGGSFLLWFVG